MGSGFLPQISFERLILGGATRNRTGDEGFADLCLTAWLWRLMSHTQKYMLYI